MDHFKSVYLNQISYHDGIYINVSRVSTSAEWCFTAVEYIPDK